MKTYEYQCSQCKSKSHRSLLDWVIQCNCGSPMTSSQATLNDRIALNTFATVSTELQSAVKEAKVIKRGKQWKHVLQCPDCAKCIIVTNYETAEKCSCGCTAHAKYSFDANGKQYEAVGGEEVVPKRSPRKANGILRTARLRLGLNQEQLAEELGITQQAVSKMEGNDSLVSEEIMEKLSGKCVTYTNPCICVYNQG